MGDNFQDSFLRGKKTEQNVFMNVEPQGWSQKYSGTTRHTKHNSLFLSLSESQCRDVHYLVDCPNRHKMPKQSYIETDIL